MAGYCKVEFEGLFRLVRDLGECADGMRSAMKQLKDIGPKGAGSDELEEACDYFQKKWGHGIGLIAEATGGITEKVARAGRLYQHLDDRVAATVRSVRTAER
ncbi:hypothetical protein ACFOOM_04680 [Streptomyces echinoruber]|uniref:Uncharacterized protein n=1 Tax=Streptomyces echinoruber TaxID=68898 RepID=A0A918VRK9_9ACTN|nr:hypothetical protein [Streptomyces echinoruber]GHA18928.1 hypothetical protein GCM10010389_65950 [Streptomyces echinoruber]